MVENYSSTYINKSIHPLNIRIELSGNVVYGILPSVYEYNINTKPATKDSQKSIYSKIYSSNRFFITIPILDQFNRLRKNKIPLQEFFLKRKLLEDVIHNLPDLREHLAAEGFRDKIGRETEESIKNSRQLLEQEDEDVEGYEPIHYGGALNQQNDKLSKLIDDAGNQFHSVDQLIKNYQYAKKFKESASAERKSFLKTINEARAQRGDPKPSHDRSITELKQALEIAFNEASDTNKQLVNAIKKPDPKNLSAAAREERKKLKEAAAAVIEKFDGKKGLRIVKRLIELKPLVSKRSKIDTDEDKIFTANLKVILNIFFVRNKIFYVSGQKFKILNASIKEIDSKNIRKAALEKEIPIAELENQILSKQHQLKVDQRYRYLKLRQTEPVVESSDIAKKLMHDAEEQVQEDERRSIRHYSSNISSSEVQRKADRIVQNLNKTKFVRENQLKYVFNNLDGIKLQRVSKVSQTVTFILVVAPYKERFLFQIKDYCRNQKDDIVNLINDKLEKNKPYIPDYKRLKTDKLKRVNINRYLENISRKKGGKYKTIRKFKKNLGKRSLKRSNK